MKNFNIEGFWYDHGESSSTWVDGTVEGLTWLPHDVLNEIFESLGVKVKGGKGAKKNVKAEGIHGHFQAAYSTNFSYGGAK